MFGVSHLRCGCVGAFASVSLCTVHSRMVAVKYLKPSLLVSDSDLDDFLNEAALLKKLSHSAIVGFIGVAVETTTSKTESHATASTRSTRRRLIDALSSRLIMKSPTQALGQESIDENGETVTEPPTATGETGAMSAPLKNVMLIQEYMTRGTLKSMLLKQMERSMRVVYTQRQALDWLIQIAQGLKWATKSFTPRIHCGV